MRHKSRGHAYVIFIQCRNNFDFMETFSPAPLPLTQKRSGLRTSMYVIIFCSISLFITLGILEVAVRIFTPPLYPILLSDERVGTIHKPNVKEFIWNEESGNAQLIFTNSLGYIGTREPSEPAGSAVRIAFIGDSVTESLQVDYQETFPHLLETTLNMSQGITEGDRVQIFNYGVGGTGTFLQLLRYREHIRPYGMDVVGLVFYDNDLEDNMNKINFDIDAYAQSNERHVGLRQFILHFALPKFLFKQFMQEIWFLKTLDFFGLYELNEHTVTKIENGRNEVARDPRYYSFTFDLIKKMRDEVEGDGSTFFVVLRHISQENTDPLTLETYERLHAFLDAEKITYVDLPVDFWAHHENPNDCLTFKCSGHFNALGHRVFSQALYPFLDTLVTQKETMKTPDSVFIAPILPSVIAH